MKENVIICGDNMEVMATLPDNSIDTIITDPPYGLGFMGKDWDTFKNTAEKANKAGYENTKVKPEIRKSPLKGYAPKSQHAGLYDHSRNAEFQQWFTLWAKEVLRIAKPGAMLLVFGGTRTYHRLTCAIEDAGWQIRDCMMWLYGSGFPKSHNISKSIDKAKGAEREVVGDNPNNRPNCAGKQMHTMSAPITVQPITSPATDLAKQWDGYGTALKPAWEPIIVAMKPLDGTFAQNAEKWGVGGLWIDGGRIKLQEHGEDKRLGGKGDWSSAKMAKNVYEGGYAGERVGSSPQGRWPANVILDETAGGMLGEPSRFFYCAKASRSERNEGLEGMEKRYAPKGNNEGRNMDNPKNHLGGMQSSKMQNNHPTVKPLKLIEYLCKLTRTPEGGIVLDPFGGSGTTAVACQNTGRKYLLIEKDPHYCEIAEARAGQRALFER